MGQSTNAIPQHLWEVKHPYYCNEGNYFASHTDKVETYYKSFKDFLAEWGDADMDYNFLFRWDWKEEDDNSEPNYNGDDNYRNGKLKVFWMGQRKGLYKYSIVEVCRNDEAAVVQFLQPRWEYMKSMWVPFTS